MKKAIHIILIVLGLIALCTVEQIIAEKYLNDVQEKVDNLYTEFLAAENIINTKLIANTNQLADFWKEKENVLCTFVNHKDIEEIGEEITKLQSSVKNNNSEQYLQSIDLIKFYLQGYKHIIGISIQNVF